MKSRILPAYLADRQLKSGDGYNSTQFVLVVLGYSVAFREILLEGSFIMMLVTGFYEFLCALTIVDNVINNKGNNIQKKFQCSGS
ncbi:MAG: hypothetical protein LC128_13560 [Chitinophagales bacterium]|nr:hypothetical protein [Chitinophagales bacterium]